jgi:hypothetical protein
VMLSSVLATQSPKILPRLLAVAVAAPVEAALLRASPGKPPLPPRSLLPPQLPPK